MAKPESWWDYPFGPTNPNTITITPRSGLFEDEKEDPRPKSNIPKVQEKPKPGRREIPQQ